jgi:hypothetical protein
VERFNIKKVIKEGVEVVSITNLLTNLFLINN